MQPYGAIVVFGGKSPCYNPINSVYGIKHTHFIMLNEWHYALYSFNFKCYASIAQQPGAIMEIGHDAIQRVMIVETLSICPRTRPPNIEN